LLIENLYSALFIFGLFTLASFLFDRALRKLGNHFDTASSEVFSILANSQKGVLIFIGSVLALSELGFDVSALVAGLGLTGFALGLALKDAISNLVAGVMIVLYKPFELGDFIEISETKGEVKDINLRYITISSEGAHNLVPNSLFLNNKLAILDVKTN